jgi:hypothetical protein
MASDELRVSKVLERWCGVAPDRATEPLVMLWDRTGEEHGHDGIPFDDEGTERLLQLLEDEFTDRRLRLRPRDLVGLTVQGLALALPAPSRAALRLAEASGRTLSDAEIERIAEAVAIRMNSAKKMATRAKRGPKQ